MTAEVAQSVPGVSIGVRRGYPRSQLLEDIVKHISSVEGQRRPSKTQRKGVSADGTTRPIAQIPGVKCAETSLVFNCGTMSSTSGQV